MGFAAHLATLILLTSCAAVVTSQTAGVVNFTRTIFPAQDRQQQFDIALAELQDTVQPFSALRNPRESTVKVFFEACFWLGFWLIRHS